MLIGHAGIVAIVIKRNGAFIAPKNMEFAPIDVRRGGDRFHGIGCRRGMVHSNCNPRIGFLAHADKYRNAVAEGQVLAPAKSIGQMQQVIFNDYVNASLAALFMLVLISMLVFGIRTIIQARARREPSAREAAFELLPEASLRP